MKKTNFLLFLLLSIPTFGSTPNEDFIVDMAREEFKIGSKVLATDVIGKTFKCVEYHSLNGALPKYNTWKIQLVFKSTGNSTIANLGNGGFKSFSLSSSGINSNAVGVSYQIQGTEFIQGRKIENGRLVFEHSVHKSRYYRGYPAVSNTGLVAYAYWICFENK